MMKDAFSTCHPFVNFSYFTLVIVFSMFFLHPVLLPISLCVAVTYSIYLNGVKALKFNVFAMIPTMLLAAAINPMFSHAGMTILYYLDNGNPITLESIFYGIAVGCMFITVIIWFSCYNKVMTSDRFIYLFGRLIPALSLILSMVLRFVPKFKSQIKEISNAQKCIGRNVSDGSIFVRARTGLTIMSILITWALENAIETADSMKSRGYGLKGRTAFSIFQIDKRDKCLLFIFLLCTAVILLGVYQGITTIKFFPAILIKPYSIFHLIVYIAYTILLSIPMILNIMEDIKWKSIKSIT
ncbi:energy-coupling factor transporter transmembrane protein EcfT [Ectobacillus sp. JY-23]|uniref:energy-coupling factor transporter transmembrane component T n=1 Tax=Ectobacillus sp. JY-23 TaxID=2933872 RepID=UPI001FF24257|nr:energy-coupling factor transporter transmembrane component T [Ectobacillus sp. JY-23]UOY91711.1 energy-coupling factor transporter transmembrane protein EcfT [Ectobacillus sp. JY-23]